MVKALDASWYSGSDAGPWIGRIALDAPPPVEWIERFNRLAQFYGSHAPAVNKDVIEMRSTSNRAATEQLTRSLIDLANAGLGRLES
jgi:hypothetical protein